uniref:E3 ubiquitin-protein ligase n=1 Tax=Naja naja TaxID=35670 RepID=A0A8C6VFG7_NAJNA
METEVQALDRSLLECSSEEIALNWLQAPDLPKEIYKHLAYYVPQIYCRGPNPAPEREDMLAQHVLLGPMEWYLCGEDPTYGFQKLEQANKPSHLCGRVFKVGEPTYSCRDCAVDSTCVLCMECFLGSVHREHRYRMTTSCGGGFCDCGDTEAWKEGSYCQKHEHSTSETEEDEDPVVHLPEDMITKVYGIFAVVFQYAVDILTWEKENELPSGLETANKNDTYYCMLFNDEVHTYEQVIYTLQKAVNCTQKEAIGFATTVDRDVSNLFNTTRQTRPLKVQVMRSSIVAHQSFGLKLLTWLSNIIGYSGTGNYRQLQRDFMEDDHERPMSVTALSVQLFTVPTLARMLIVEENLLTTIISTFMDHLRHRDIQGRFQFERYTALQAFKFRRVQSLILDLKYVLISKPTEWSDQLRQKFLEGFDVFLELLRCMQGMDPITRQVGQHIEMEPEWEAAFTLQMKLTHVISMMQDWCALDEKVLIEAYKKCLTALMQCHCGFTDGEQPIELSMCGHSVETIRYCVSQEKVSIHLPVSRLLAGLHALLSKTEVAYKFPDPPMLIEHPLRCLVLCAQVHAGMWRRNGFSLVNQIYYYHNVKCRREMFDKDIVMLQTGVSMMDPNHFLMMMLCRFELYQIFSTPDYGKRFSSENTNKCLLILLICFTGERFTPGIGQINATDEIKREIIHQLSIRPMAHSELVKALPEDENKETGMETVIEAVACFKKPGLTGRGLYELKPECAKDFNLYFYHFSRAEQSKVIMQDENIHYIIIYNYKAFLINILQCDVMLCLMRTILQWAVEHNGYAWSESMLQRVCKVYINSRIKLCRIYSTSEKENFAIFLPRFFTWLEWHYKKKNNILRMLVKIIFSRDKEKAERKRKAEIARLRREKIMAQMSEMQRHFIDENRELFQQTIDELETSTSRVHDHRLIALGPEQTKVCEQRQIVTCILCQEEQEVKMDNRAMVLAAFVQRSTVLSKNRNKVISDPEKYDPLFMHPDLSCGTHTGSCGHIMHAHCWQRYFDAVQAKEQRRQQRLRVHTSYDVENGEFLCPLCECLSNTVIPLLPPPRTLFSRNPYSESIKEMLKTFGTATYKVGLKVHPNEEDPRVPIMCWGSCAFTIQAIGGLSCKYIVIFPFITYYFLLYLQVCLIFSFPAVHCQDFSGVSLGTGDIHIFHLVTMAHIVQIILTSSTGKAYCLGYIKCIIFKPEIFFVEKQNNFISSPLKEISSGWHLWKSIKTGIMPFLRCSAMFFHYLNGVPIPSELKANGANQFEYLCSYLSLPSNLICLFQENSKITNTLIESYPRESNKLIELPEDYSCLINQASNFSCPKSGGDKSRAPTLCLVCGTMLCSQSYCCQTELEGEDVGACTAHTYTCGSGVGIFLRVRECQVLFLAGKTKGCFYAPPYLDDYGETDQGLRRGNPLHLCRERFKKIQKLWQQHSITEEIGHAQEANQTLVGIDWQHL